MEPTRQGTSMKDESLGVHFPRFFGTYTALPKGYSPQKKGPD